MLKQLYLKPRLLILDEPTSVLTPQEADEVLGHVLKARAAGDCTVIMITHKFREVAEHADDVSVLRKGTLVASLRGGRHDPTLLAAGHGGRGARAAGDSGPRAQGRSRGATAAAGGARLSSPATAAQLAVQGPERCRCTPARSSAWPASRATASAS
jgi:general nucleoside transport system ATP-binding protein